VDIGVLRKNIVIHEGHVPGGSYLGRRTNYGFQKQQTQMKKQKKREEKAEKKRLKAEPEESSPPQTDTTDTENS
jgi:hypothetical protein